MVIGLARIISVLFHPLLILTYMLVLMLVAHPYTFGVHHIGEEVPLILLMFFSTVLIPGIAVAMLKMLGLVKSLQLEDRHERIGPYIITSIFYLWLLINFLNNAQIPMEYTAFVLGATIGLFLAFFINIFSKISAHTVGMGGLLAMIMLTMARYQQNILFIDLGPFGVLQMQMVAILMLAILAAGMVGTARLLLQAHSLQEVYGGYLVGFGAQLIAWHILF